MISVKDFKFELFESKKPIETKSKDNKSFKYTLVPFVYDGKEVLMKMSGIFISFMNVKDGQVSYSIRMTEDEANKDFLLALERRIRGQVASQIYDLNKERLTNRFLFPEKRPEKHPEKRPLDVWRGSLPCDVSLTPKNIEFSQLIICCWLELHMSRWT